MDALNNILLIGMTNRRAPAKIGFQVLTKPKVNVVDALNNILLIGITKGARLPCYGTGWCLYLWHSTLKSS